MFVKLNDTKMEKLTLIRDIKLISKTNSRRVTVQ
jgi:hypothetical protein